MRVYNTEIKTFPGVIWASTVYRSAKPLESFAASANAQSAPTVSFAPPAAPAAAKPANQ